MSNEKPDPAAAHDAAAITQESTHESSRGWIRQIVRARGRAARRRSAHPATATKHNKSTEGVWPEQARNALELQQLCDYGESSDADLLVDDSALEALCFQEDSTLAKAYAESALPAAASKRHSRRVLTPKGFYHVGADGYFQAIDVDVILPPQLSKRVINCYVHDVNDHGVAFVADQELASGTPITLCLSHADNATPLVACETVVLHSKPLPSDSNIPEAYVGRPLWLHGVALPKRDALVIYKATLDSLAFNAASSTRHDN